ncbi:hypothetical protein HDV06_003072 [Boothiomyces sp. JEL0866]|nr:hypothetical protein HDV06_000516 [Boothiomyces sp. JEL0866]KAJ3322352.1 hypothetical protein HDV06_003072 [Boothiomyces sp. JEL0866]
MLIFKRFISSHPAQLGFAFDIDGVLIRGAKVLPQGVKMLKLLQEKKCPFILLTNGGGVTEANKAKELSVKFHLPLHPKQIVLSHSPMQRLATKYSNKPVLIVGKDTCRDVAHSYGFKHVVTPDDIYEWNHTVWPFKNPPTSPRKDLNFENLQVAAIMMFHDSWDWGKDMQIMCDILRSNEGKLGTLTKDPTKQSVPLYFSNSDFIWSNDYPLTRFAQGAFRTSLEAVYSRLTGNKLQYTRFGKPEAETYRFAEDLLDNLSDEMWPDHQHVQRTVYAIGDNPASDIQGANSHGWESILVRTGVWDESHGHDHNAKYLVHDVEEASESGMKDIRDFFKPKGNPKKEQRSVVIVDSDDEAPDEKPKTAPVKRKLPDAFDSTPKKLVEPSSFFNKPVSQSEKTITKKGNKESNDNEFDIAAMKLLDEVEKNEKSKENFIPEDKSAVRMTKFEKESEKVKPVNKDTTQKRKSEDPVEKSQKVVVLSETKSPTKDIPSADDKDAGEQPKNYHEYAARKASHAQAIVHRPAPIGAPNCLAGLTFVFTGDLASLSREDATDIIKRYGGRVTSAPSKKTSYVVVGQDPGPKKMEKIAGLKLKTLNEDEFYDFINSFGSNPATVPAATVSVAQPDVVKPASAKMPVKDKGKAPISATIPFTKPSSSDQLWTDKYKPQNYNEVIANKTLIEKLALWVRDWDKNRKAGFPKGSKDSVTQFRAALLSGPPGIGKTTSAHLVAKFENVDVLEFNASDSRSKKTLDDLVREATLSGTVKDFFAGKPQSKGKKVIIMDEVDGMSSGDRGGIAEIIQIIKKSHVPIICICNERSSPKIRSLANYCLDLRFRRATAQQVEARLKIIAQKEGLTLEPNAIAELVASTSGDIRQILNMLSTYRLSHNNLSFDDSKNMYRAVGKQMNCQVMSLIAQAADSISLGDILDSSQRKENSWSLLPIHGVISTIRPCFFAHGQLKGMINFPSWLGQNSKQGKGNRLLRELQLHTRLHTSADKHELCLSYMPLLAKKLTKPMIESEAGVTEVIELMDNYYLNKDDFDSIMELGYQSYPSGIPSKTKSSFTRSYNKSSHPTPFSSELKPARPSSTMEVPDLEDVVLEDDAQEEEEEEEEDKPSNIVKPKGKAAKPSAKISSSKGKKGK